MTAAERIALIARCNAARQRSGIVQHVAERVVMTASERARKRRDRNVAAGRCINDTERPSHGPREGGLRCAACARVHKANRQ